jgi:hypothetical protein
MFEGIKKFALGKPVRRGLFLAAWLQLGRAWWLLRRRPVREVLAGFGRDGEDENAPPCSPGQLETADAIGRAVRAAAARTPWPSSCLVQVLAAQRMLRARGIGGAVFIGAARQGEEFEFGAHAWLKCGALFVTGEGGHESYTVISRFSWSPAA